MDRPARARQPLHGGAILAEMLRLPPHRLLPGKAEPGEILVDAGLELRPASGQVDVLDAQQEAAPDTRASSALSSAE